LSARYLNFLSNVSNPRAKRKKLQTTLDLLPELFSGSQRRAAAVGMPKSLFGYISRDVLKIRSTSAGADNGLPPKASVCLWRRLQKQDADLYSSAHCAFHNGAKQSFS
jgi:hypothetical protein